MEILLSYGIKILSPIFVLAVLIAVHEFGHFIVAKWCGVGVLRFSIGFGPALIRWRRKETEYQISLIPLGGFVRMVGDMPDAITGPSPTDESVREKSADNANEQTASEEEVPEIVKKVLSDENSWFINKNLWQRSAIVFAGPFLNFLLAIILLATSFYFYGAQNLLEGAVIGSVSDGSPALAAGLRENDEVLEINGQKVNSWEQLSGFIKNSRGSALTIDILREGEELTLTAYPQRKELKTLTGETEEAFLIGIGPRFVHEELGFVDSLSGGFVATINYTMLTYQGLWGMLTMKVSPQDLAGPIFIIDAAGKHAEQGLDSVFRFMALLSVSLAVLNLLPIPILDGGHLMFFFLEALFGPISIRKKEFAQQIGFCLLMFLMIFAVTNDIRRDPSAMEVGVNWKQGEAAPETGNNGKKQAE